MRRAAWLLTVVVAVGACTRDPQSSVDPIRPDRKDLPQGYGFAERKDRKSNKPPANWRQAACSVDSKLIKRIRRGYYPGRSPELVALPQSPNYFGGFESTSHAGPWDYVQEVPLVFYGPGQVAKRGTISLDREATVADLAPTLAGLMHTHFPTGRPGDAIPKIGVAGAKPPKLVVTIVWDGGGTDVLETWPRAWPHLEDMMRRGTAVAGATVGSSPSVTPATHATIGTGAFPNRHGVVDIKIRDGDEIFDAYPLKTPQYLALPTLADLYDQSTGNEAKIGMLGYRGGWHLGMMSHGSYIPGGDSDIAVVIPNFGTTIAGALPYYERLYYVNEVPGFERAIRAVDLEDGKQDGAWLGHDVLDDSRGIRHEAPTYILYQTRVAKSILDIEGFGDDDVTDMFFMNYKPIDSIGHNYNMLDPEVRSAVRHADDQLGKLVRFLNREVGRRQWVIAMTADHGQTPAASETGAWAIGIEDVVNDVSNRFDIPVGELFDDRRPGHFWLNTDVMRANGVTTGDIADFLSKYTIGDNWSPNVPDGYGDRKDELVFDAAWPTSRMDKVSDCVAAARLN